MLRSGRQSYLPRDRGMARMSRVLMYLREAEMEVED